MVKAVRDEWKSIVQTLGSLMIYAVGYYVIFLYLTTFLIERVHVPAWEAMEINTVSMVVLMVLIPFMAHLSDKIGRKPLLLFASIGLMLFSYPFIYLMHQPEYWHMQLGQIGFSVFVAAYAGVNPATMVEGFPADVRCSGMSFSFNLSFAVFGGTAPMVAAWLINRTHDDFSVAWFLIVAAAISTVSVLMREETAHDPIETYQDLLDGGGEGLATEKAGA